MHIICFRAPSWLAYWRKQSQLFYSFLFYFETYKQSQHIESIKNFPCLMIVLLCTCFEMSPKMAAILTMYYNLLAFKFHCLLKPLCTNLNKLAEFVDKFDNLGTLICGLD